MLGRCEQPQRIPGAQPGHVRRRHHDEDTEAQERQLLPRDVVGRHQRIDRAVVAAVAEMHATGTSTRKVQRIAEKLGISKLSRDQVSAIVKDLDADLAETVRKMILASLELAEKVDAAKHSRLDPGLGRRPNPLVVPICRSLELLSASPTRTAYTNIPDATQHVHVVQHQVSSIISTPLCSQSLRSICPTSPAIWSYMILRLYFGVNAMWYLHAHFACERLRAFWAMARTIATIRRGSGFKAGCHPPA